MFIDQTLVFDMGSYTATTGLVGANQYASSATNTSTNILDMQQRRDLGGGLDGGFEVTANFLITTAFSGGTSVNFQLQGSTDNTTWTTYSETGAIAVASLGANVSLNLPVPAVNPDGGLIPRYYRTAYVNAGANTAGAVIAWLGPRSTLRFYPPGVVVNN